VLLLPQVDSDLETDQLPLAQLCLLHTPPPAQENEGMLIFAES